MLKFHRILHLHTAIGVVSGFGGLSGCGLSGLDGLSALGGLVRGSGFGGRLKVCAYKFIYTCH